MINYFLLVVVILCLLLNVLIVTDARKERTENAKMVSEERQMLLDRIQARDLPEYKAVTVPNKPPEPRVPKDEYIQV